MNDFQKKKLKSGLEMLSFIVTLIILTVGLFLAPVFVLIVSAAGIVVSIVIVLAHCIATMIYKWRIMGVTEDWSEPMFELCWRYCSLGELESRIEELARTRENHPEFLYLTKVSKVKKPKILSKNKKRG